VAVSLYDPRQKLGAMAHVMLPGAPPVSTPPDRRGRYVGHALSAMLACLIERGARREDVFATVVGAGNVLRKLDDCICSQNITSTVALLTDLDIVLRGHRLGGYVRRSAELDLAGGQVYYTEDGGPRRLLWSPQDPFEMSATDARRGQEPLAALLAGD
jgi:chemotaxis receptor (MCP) glutamine deamidase CheD